MQSYILRAACNGKIRMRQLRRKRRQWSNNSCLLIRRHRRRESRLAVDILRTNERTNERTGGESERRAVPRSFILTVMNESHQKILHLINTFLDSVLLPRMHFSPDFPDSHAGRSRLLVPSPALCHQADGRQHGGVTAAEVRAKVRGTSSQANDDRPRQTTNARRARGSYRRMRLRILLQPMIVLLPEFNHSGARTHVRRPA